MCSAIIEYLKYWRFTAKSNIYIGKKSKAETQGVANTHKHIKFFLYPFCYFRVLKNVPRGLNYDHNIILFNFFQIILLCNRRLRLAQNEKLLVKKADVT